MYYGWSVRSPPGATSVYGCTITRSSPGWLPYRYTHNLDPGTATLRDHSIHGCTGTRDTDDTPLDYPLDLLSTSVPSTGQYGPPVSDLSYISYSNGVTVVLVDGWLHGYTIAMILVALDSHLPSLAPVH